MVATAAKRILGRDRDFSYVRFLVFFVVGYSVGYSVGSSFFCVWVVIREGLCG